MKYLLVVAVALVAFAAADDEWKPTIGIANFRKIHDDCLRVSGVTKEQFQKILYTEDPNENNLETHVHCGVKGLGVFTDERGYDLSRVMSQFDAMFVNAEEVRDVVSSCVSSSEQSSTPTERAYRPLRCLVKAKINEILKDRKHKDDTEEIAS